MKPDNRPEVKNTETIIPDQLNENAGQESETANPASPDIATQEGCGICGTRCGNGC